MILILGKLSVKDRQTTVYIINETLLTPLHIRRRPLVIGLKNGASIHVILKFMHKFFITLNDKNANLQICRQNNYKDEI
jgi:hypothetical protein